MDVRYANVFTIIRPARPGECLKRLVSVKLQHYAGIASMLVAISMATANADEPAKKMSPAASPAPKPVSIASKLKVSGVIRAYSFDREFQVGTNQSATNFLGGLHADYAISPVFTLGAGYDGIYAFGTNGHNAQFNGLADNSLPASTISAFPETYLKYADKRTTVTLGNQYLNEKWESPSDVRLMPAAYQGISASYKIAKNLSFSADRVIRFEPRTASKFGRYTLLTAPILGLSKTPEQDTSGALAAHLKYASPYVSALVEDYNFYDIGNLSYAEARGNLSLKGAKPFIALQYVGENNIGKSIVGRIQSHTYGVQLGANVTRNVVATVAYNGSPTEVASSPTGIFGASKISGSSKYGYGGIAGAYNTGYGTDPLFTTGLIDNADTRSPRAFKAALTYTSDDKRLVFYATREYFENVGYNPGDTHYETEGDITYYLNKIGKGAYKGLSIRERYGVRNTPTEKNPSFQQARTMVQYTF